MDLKKELELMFHDGAIKGFGVLIKSFEEIKQELKNENEDDPLLPLSLVIDLIQKFKDGYEKESKNNGKSRISRT